MQIHTIATIALFALCQFGMVGTTFLTSEAATNFNGSTIVGIDNSQRTITFRTRQGESWTLPVNDPDLLTKGQIAPGDQVSIEIDLNDRITKILKPSGEPQATRSESREEAQ